MEVRTLCALIVALAAAACGGGSGTSDPAPAVTGTSATIGPEGGTIQVSDPANQLNGLSVRIPKGALATPTTIMVERTAAVSSTSLGNEQLVLTLSPDGTVFTKAIEVTLPLPFAPPSAKSIGLYQTSDASGEWSEVEGGTYNPATGTMMFSISHFSKVLIVPTRPQLPVPPSGTYTFSILTSDLPGVDAYTSAEASAIEAAITSGPLQPFYACAGNYGFARVPHPSSGNPTASIVILKRTIPRVAQLASFRWNATFTQAFITSRLEDVETGLPIKLHAGTGPVPQDFYDLRTIAAHELSHFMSIPSQPTGYDPKGLFFEELPKGVSRPLTTSDKAGLVERFPNCDLPVISIAATPSAATINQSITLTWSVKNYAASCTASGDWAGSLAASGSVSVNSGATAGPRRYSLACVGPMGTGEASASATVSANQPPPPTSSRLNVVAGTDPVAGRIFTITWQFPSGFQYDLWLYVGGGAQWQHVVSADYASNADIPLVASNQVGTSYCFKMTAVDPGVASGVWPPLGAIRHQALSGNKFPCL